MVPSTTYYVPVARTRSGKLLTGFKSTRGEKNLRYPVDPITKILQTHPIQSRNRKQRERERERESSIDTKTTKTHPIALQPHKYKNRASRDDMNGEVASVLFCTRSTTQARKGNLRLTSHLSPSRRSTTTHIALHMPSSIIHHLHQIRHY